MTLRGVGEAKANDILKYRESHGGFQKIEDIMKISGIKDAAFQKIKEDITV
jgi:competence protein ComEA